MTLIVANLVAWGLAFRMRRRATISWYVSRRHRQEEQRRRRFWKQAILLAVCVACVIIMTGLYVSEQWLGIIVPAVLVTAFCISRHNEKVEPVIVGQHEGLNILAGLSSSFLQKVNDMIEQHRAKHAAD